MTRGSLDPRISGLLRLGGRIRRAGQRGLNLAMRDIPKCHYALLARLCHAMDRCGRNDCVYVSDLIAALHESPPAVSRLLLTLERDGLIQRRTDPKDRRKTLVCLTPEGKQAYLACERAVQEYFCAVLDDLGQERTELIYNGLVALVETLERHNDLAESSCEE